MKQSKQWLLLSNQDTWVRPYLKKYKGLLIFVLFLGLLTFFCGAALMFTSGYLISKAATKPYNILLIYVPIVLTRAFGIGRPAFRYVERLASHNWVLKMTSDIRLKLYRSLETRAMQVRQDFQTGNILGILTEDIEHIQNLYLRTIFPTLIAWALYILIVIGLGLFSIPFALIMLLLVGMLVIGLPVVSVLVNQAAVYRRKAKRHVLYTDLTDTILGVGDWQYSGRYQDFMEHYRDAEQQAWEQEDHLQRATRWQNLAGQFLFGLMVVSLFLWTGHYFYGTGEGLNWIAAFVLAAFPLMDAFGPISQGMMEMPMYEDTVERLHQLPQPAEEKIKKKKFGSHDFQINFDQLSFRYHENQRLILHDFHLMIPQGETIAVLGRSGTGKTTLTKLLQGDLVPEKGQVLIGGSSAQQIMNEYEDVLAVLDQAPHLFNTSILNNVRLGNLQASDEEIRTALQQVGLQPLLDRLPKGADTLVEEGGKRFSGGEQQRIALARILLQDAPIVILDEPTVGLDPLTERALLDTIFEVLDGKTILWVTHHLIGVNHVDRVLFLNQGSIEMEGTPQELMRENKHFQHLYRLDTAQ